MLTQEELHKEWDRVEANIGRYPTGFRQYENYEFYALSNPDATMVDYQSEMNRQCEFHEFMAIMRAALIEQAKTPGFRFDAVKQTEDDDNEYRAESFVLTEAFEEEMRELYQQTLTDYLLKKEWFKLIDCLEETVNFWSYGRDIARAPLHGSYIPVRHTIMPKPRMDPTNDELDYRFNLHKLGPTEQLNPLKSYKMSPQFKEKNWSGLYEYRSRKRWVKDRRLSHSKFSTLDKRNHIDSCNNLSAPSSGFSSLFGGFNLSNISAYNPMHQMMLRNFWPKKGDNQ